MHAQGESTQTITTKFTALSSRKPPRPLQIILQGIYSAHEGDYDVTGSCHSSIVTQ